MNYLNIKDFDIANGPGIRVSLWVSGCDVHCPGCHNPESWDFNAGKPFTQKTIDKIIEMLDSPVIRGLTVTGGHPLAFQNREWVYKLISQVRRQLPDKDIWLYTGYVMQIGNFIENAKIDLRDDIVQMCDVIVDGPYVEEERDISLLWRGSRNQRLIDVKKTMETQEFHYYGEINLDLL